MKWTVYIGQEEWTFDRPESQIGDRNKAFICPFCLHIWASMCCEEPWQPIFDIEHASCSECDVRNYGTDFPGSLLSYSILWNGCDEDLINHLPLPLLKRELELHLKVYDDNQYTLDRIFGT